MNRDRLLHYLQSDDISTPGECDFALTLVQAWMAEHPDDFGVGMTAESVSMLRSCWDADGNPLPDYPMGDPRHSKPWDWKE